MTNLDKRIAVKKYWIYITDENFKLLLKVNDDGTVEYGETYTPAKARVLFDLHFGVQNKAENLLEIKPGGPAIEGHEIAVVKSITPNTEKSKC